MDRPAFENLLYLAQIAAHLNAVPSVRQFSWFHNPYIGFPPLSVLVVSLQKRGVLLVLSAGDDMIGERKVLPVVLLRKFVVLLHSVEEGLLVSEHSTKFQMIGNPFYVQHLQLLE